MDSEALSSRQHCLISSDDDGTSDDDLSLFIKSESETHKLLKNQQNLACHPSATASVPVTSFHHRNGRYAKYTSLAHNEHGFGGLVGQSSRRSRLLYSPWTVFSITILFFLLLYIPLFTFRDSTGMYPIPGWEVNTTRDTAYYVLPQLNTTLIDPVHICDDKMLLLIVVCSSSVNFEIRKTIRETWANTSEFNYSFFHKMHANQRSMYLDIDFAPWRQFSSSAPINNSNSVTKPDAPSTRASANKDIRDNVNFSVKVVFLVGETANNETQLRIGQESEMFGDVIQESFVDSYNNLTLKTIMMLKWVTTNCGDRVKFLMKCDDDTFVNVPNLLHILLGGTMPAYNVTVHEFDQETIKTRLASNRMRRTKGLLLGSMFCNSKPIANTSSKWYTPVYMYSGNTYPNYLSGTAYVMSMDVAQRLYNVSLSTPIFHLEDVYLTGICAEAAHITPVNHPLFSYTDFKEQCELRGMINKHQLTSGEMRSAYEWVTDQATNCSRPDRTIHLRKPKANALGCR